MADSVTEQIVREAPEIEAYKLGLLQSAKQLADQRITLPTQQVAQMSGLQQAALQAASPASGGIGGYEPYLGTAGQTMGMAAPQIVAAGQTASPYITGSYGTAGQMFQQGAGPVTGQQIAQYMNPYQQAVQDEISRSFAQQRAAAGLGAVGAPGGPSAFGGSRAAIQQTELGRNEAAALAQSQAQNFLQAQQAATNEQQRRLAAAQGIGTLGLQAGQALGQLGLQSGQALGQLGLQQASLGELAQQSALRDITTQFELGKQQQAQQQATIEAERQSQLAQLYEPYQRYAYLSDIYKGAPSTQQTLTSSTAPNVSPAQQYLGLGIAGLSAAAGANKLFGGGGLFG